MQHTFTGMAVSSILAADVFQVSDGAFKAAGSTCISPVKSDAS